MKTTTRLILTALLVLPMLAACKKEEATTATAATQAPLVAPATADDAAWRTYVSDVVTRNMDATMVNQPFVYYLPAATGNEDEDAGAYDRLLDKARTDVARGIVRGNMLAYASSDSTKMADIVVEAFQAVEPDTMKGVRVVFIGAAADQARVADVVAPAGVDFVFVEAK